MQESLVTTYCRPNNSRRKSESLQIGDLAAGAAQEIGPNFSLEGKASMWLLSPAMWETAHRDRLRVGTRGYFMEGARRVGEVVVDSIAECHTCPYNPPLQPTGSAGG